MAKKYKEPGENSALFLFGKFNFVSTKRGGGKVFCKVHNLFTIIFFDVFDRKKW